MAFPRRFSIFRGPPPKKQRRLIPVQERGVIAIQARSVEEQAVDAGFGFTWIDPSGLLSGPYHYNASLLEIEGSLWLAYRRQRDDRVSDVVAVKLDESFTPIPNTNRVLLPLDKTENAEDPRLFWFDGRPWLSFASWKKPPTVAVGLCELNQNLGIQRQIRTEWEGNWKIGVAQKNWIFFEHEKELFFVYYSNPHEIAQLDPVSGVAQRVSREQGIEWDFGPIRGGTPPIRHKDLYYSFFHSRLSEGKRTRYYMGAYAFEAKPPFRPVLVTKQPLLTASERDKNLPFLPLVVFPSGAMKRDGEWVVSLGVNDVSTAIVKIDHAILSRRLCVGKSLIEQIETRLPKMMGWCPVEKASAMATAIVETRPRNIVEIGVFGGRSLLAMALACRHIQSGHVYGIDPWTAAAALQNMEEADHIKWWNGFDYEQIYRECLKNVADVKGFCTILRTTSEQAAASFDEVHMLHIDGNHTEEGSIRDVLLWLPKVAPGAYIWFDDIDWPSTKRAIGLLEESCERLPDVGTCGLFKKR